MARSLLDELLIMDPQKRITAEKALELDWMRGTEFPKMLPMMYVFKNGALMFDFLLLFNNFWFGSFTMFRIQSLRYGLASLVFSSSRNNYWSSSIICSLGWCSWAIVICCCLQNYHQKVKCKVFLQQPRFLFLVTQTKRLLVILEKQLTVNLLQKVRQHITGWHGRCTNFPLD